MAPVGLVLCLVLPEAVRCGAYSHCNFAEKYVKSTSRQVPGKFEQNFSKIRCKSNCGGCGTRFQLVLTQDRTGAIQPSGQGVECSNQQGKQHGRFAHFFLSKRFGLSFFVVQVRRVPDGRAWCLWPRGAVGVLWVLTPGFHNSGVAAPRW
jgi:hypothetical protein